MTLGDINRWLAAYAKDYAHDGISPEQAIALCRWKLSDKVDGEPWSRMMPQFANCCETNTEDMP